MCTVVNILKNSVATFYLAKDHITLLVIIVINILKYFRYIFKKS